MGSDHTPSASSRPSRASLPTLQLNPTAQRPALPSADGETPTRSGYAETTNAIPATIPRVTPRVGFWRGAQAFFAHRGQSEEDRRARRRLVRNTVSLVFLIAQFVLTAVLTAYGLRRKVKTGSFGVKTEFQLCHNLAVMNIVWLGRAALSWYLHVWLYFTHGSWTGAADVLCPLTVNSVHFLLVKLDPALTLLCIIFSVAFFVGQGRQCLGYAPHIFSLAVIVPSCAALQLVWKYGVVTLLRMRGPVGLTSRYLTQAEVDTIPLVYYIPAPPDSTPVSPTSPVSPSNPSKRSPVSPKSLRSPTKLLKKAHRFVFFRPRTATDDDDVESGTAKSGVGVVGAERPPEANWSTASLPYVRLEENHARCSICIEDFRAPPKLTSPALSPPEVACAADGAGEVYEMGPVANERASLVEVRVVDSSADGGEDERSTLTPLRLLGCGHAFHKECVDRWLTECAVWCPNCKVPAEVYMSFGQVWKSWWRDVL
ncbi:hypothetical protein C8Q77DRAFT_502872 [Trametes polyzona]|nr:hypothetical protein C8Q77DRAFT_502872 [Trametes polyzona]